MGHELMVEAAATADAQACRAEAAERRVRKLQAQVWVLRAVCVILAIGLGVAW